MTACRLRAGLALRDAGQRPLLVRVRDDEHVPPSFPLPRTFSLPYTSFVNMLFLYGFRRARHSVCLK